MEENREKVLSVKNLVVSFKTDRGIVHAVRGVSFDLYRGETLCIVGESGSGKSVTNKAIMGISSANAIIENGSIIYNGEDLVRVSEEEFHRIRGHEIGMIFQDPLSALNPVMKVGKQITEAMLINKNVLKRHYQNLVIKELTALRNVEANANFEINQAENEITKNKETVESFKKVFKKISRYEKVLEKKSDVAKIQENLEYAKKDLDKQIFKFKEYINIVNTNLGGEITRCNEVLTSLPKKIENAPTELKKQIQTNRQMRYTNLLEFYKTIENALSEESTNYIEDLNLRNNQLKELIKIVKKNLKLSLPALKKDYSIRKKAAKKETVEYEKSIIKEHETKMNSLKEELNQTEIKIDEFLAKLSEEEKTSLKEIIARNEKKIKMKHRLESKNKDVNVSKISKDGALELEPIPYEELKVLYETRETIVSKIEDEKRDFVNKTKITKTEAKKKALQVMKEVGIPLPERRFKQYPFEFSGGMRQRIVIAIALTANPDILICDEPTTALDVTIQAQILELINKLKKERNLSCIFITHDLGVVANMADRVAVMYAGKIVEYGTAREVFFEPKHPYTWALLSSIPDVDSKEKLEAIPGTPPDMLYPPIGDAFALRSKYALAIDFKYEPPFFKVSDTHYAATWLLYPGAPEVEMPKIVKTRIENSLREEKERLEKENKEEEK